ncbi:hypothetical protein TUM3792_19260 [Shewanella sp. MBTL60-007]|nr:hypothetical protein TUM3792_19260 [Shewanella sp. MBTL60-007]
MLVTITKYVTILIDMSLIIFTYKLETDVIRKPIINTILGDNTSYFVRYIAITSMINKVKTSKTNI